MEKKYISENRYKKNTGRKRRDVSNIRKIDKYSNNLKQNTVRKKKKTKIKASARRERRTNRRNILLCVILLILIAIILRAILKEEGEPFIPFYFGSEENEQIITVGIITDENLLDSNLNNIVMKELGYYSNHMLLTINEDYSLKYNIIESIENKTNKEYIITVKKSREYDANTVKHVLDSHLSNTKSLYYEAFKDVSNIELKDSRTLLIRLKSENPYFIYNLEIPILKTDRKQYEQTEQSSANSIEFERTKYASEESPKKIVVKKYKDMYTGVEAYKKGDIAVLITNQNNVQNMIGKYEYNLKTYRTGETIFLFFNKNSEWIKKDEIRRVIAYGIDRDTICKEIFQSGANVIDLPYIYDNVKYKYDIYAAENLLLSNGYLKKNNVYSKNGNQITLNLLVNKNDSEKIEIANNIKNNLAAIGISINIEKLTSQNIEQRIKNEKYDLVLGTVSLNKIPDISFLNNSLYTTKEYENIIKKISEQNVLRLADCIKELTIDMSNNISCVGIAAKTSYIIYNKQISGFTNASYLNIFRGLIK